MAVLRTFYKCIIVIGTSNENTSIIKEALSQDYKLFFAQNLKTAQKYYAKYEKNILEFIIDAQNNPDLAIEFLREWETDLAYQSIPAVALVDFNKREIEHNILNHQVTNIMYSPFTSEKILRHVETTVKRNALIENRMIEIYDDKFKTINEKILLIPASINCGVAFLRIEKDQVIIDYANKIFIKLFGCDTFNGVLSQLSNEDGASLLAATSKAKLSFEPTSIMIDVEIENNLRVYEVTIAQIPNLDTQAYEDYIYKFIVSVIDRTDREEYKDNYHASKHLFESIVNNINGGVMVVEVVDDFPKLISASDSLLRYTGLRADDPNFILKMLPPSTIETIISERKSREPNIFNGVEESISLVTKVNTADGTSKHAKFATVLYRYEDRIRANTLILDDTKEFESNQKLKMLHEFDQTTNLFNDNKFIEATDKLIRHDDDKKYKIIVARIYKFDEFQSFFGKNKTIELLKVVAEGIKKLAPNCIKGRIDNKAFAISYDEEMLDEKKFTKELDEYVKENYTSYQIKIYYGIYSITDIYDAVDSMLIQTTFAIREIEGNALKNYIYCDSKLKNRILESDNITNEMKKALENNEFEVFLQPVFDLKTRKILSAEALTRWHHPKRGYIPPTEYIPIFEENGFIVNVDHFVWESACKIIRGWLDAKVNAVPISVNVSRIDLFNIDFYTVITELVEKYDIPVEYLRLEITESAFVLNENSVIEIVDRLRNYGFKILMDDFGSGYSSLNSLKFINVDFLKIDMDLVRGIEESIKQANILKSVINLGTTLNLDMICEGVETEKQAEFVNGCGCEKAQGWLFSKAIPINEFNEKMKSN